MTRNILSLYKKTWPGNKFGVSFLHDSIHCEHCLKGKINIVSEIGSRPNTRNNDPPGVEDLSKSFFHQSHLKSFTEIKYNSIPKSSFSPLGVKITKSVAAKLNQSCDVKKTRKKPLQNQSVRKNIFKSIKKPRCNNNCDSKKVRRPLKTENKELVHKDINDIYHTPSKARRNFQNKTCEIPKETQKSPSKSSKGTKGTLKRKRWTLQKLKESNLNYEDDLFENQKFCNFQSMIEDDSDSNKYEEMRTPQISLSPVRDGSSTPPCNDCYSPGELFNNRKEAEEYIFRRAKRRKLKLQDEIDKSGSSLEPSPEKLNRAEAYTICILQNACHLLQKVSFKEKENNGSDNEEKEDDYFTSDTDSSEIC